MHSSNSQTKTLLSIHYLIFIVVFIEGFVSVAIEILTIRQLLPVVGGSVIVTSLVIGIFLLFLALGYRKGGRIQTNLQQTLQRNFFIASIWLGTGLSYLFIFFFFLYLQNNLEISTTYSLIFYLLLVVAPLIYILGQTIPVTMNMIKYDKSIGKIGGDTLGLSTLGSFLGAVVTATVFMNYFGVAWTVFINSILLLGLAILFSANKHSVSIQLIFAVLFSYFIYVINIAIEEKLFVKTNNYANYEIVQTHPTPNDEEKILLINNSYSSIIKKDKKGFAYIEAIKKILFEDLQLRHANILVLGAGGFSLSAENNFQNKFTYVDIDPNLKSIVVPNFIKRLNDPLIVDDARHFVNASQNQYDAIVIDVFSNVKSIPAHLLTKEFMSDVKNKLSTNGTAIFNIIANPNLLDLYSKRIDNTIRLIFQHCMTTPLSYANALTNIIYVCRKNDDPVDRMVYSDNLNRATTDSFAW
jgi:predicted membrane-bound spermidine synthase